MEKDEISRGIEDAVEMLGSTFVGKIHDPAMRKVINAYKEEMLQWFSKGVADKENPMKYATQEHWYSLYLEKKRLENHRCMIQYVEYKHIPYNMGEEPETMCLYRPDGKYMVCKASQMTKLHKKYIRDEVVIGQEEQKRDITYYILRAQNENRQYICPNCGAEQSLDELLDGCDYCKTKFDVSVYDDKIMSVMKNKTRFDSREGTSAGQMGYIFLAAFGVIGVILGLFAVLFTCGLSLIGSALGGVVAYYGFMGATKAGKGQQDNTLCKYKLEDNNLNFSMEDFIGSLDCKLKSIHYASNPQELAAFVKCNITPFVESYQNIVSCETGKIAMKNHRIEGDYQYVDLHREMEVIKDCDTHLEAANGVVGVTLAKKVSHKLKNDISMYRCGGCGATISLVEGGKCKYCGNEMEYAAYDWVVVGYRHVDAL